MREREFKRLVMIELDNFIEEHLELLKKDLTLPQIRQEPLWWEAFLSYLKDKNKI